MLALCVNMQYSLARWRHFKPSPPFQLGGVYQLISGRHFLCDAFGRVEFHCERVPASTGDLISADVAGVEKEILLVSKAERLHTSSGPEARPAADHVGRFPFFVRAVRDFFVRQGVREVLTPTLVKCPGLEPSLWPFSTEVLKGSARERAFLPTSPEIHLKKALTRGWTDIFEIKNCFRNNEDSPHHANEFLMLEWYRAYADLDLIASDLRELLAFLNAHGWGEKADVRRLTFKDLFRQHLEFELRADCAREELAVLCERNGVEFMKGDSFNDLFHRLLIEKIEPHLSEYGAVIVSGFLPSMAALAKLDGEGFADRFEFYWNGLEIANAFNEVTDPEEQSRRWQLELEERRHLGTGELPVDEELIEALKRGLPPTGGIALGMERLYMACTGCADIRELRLW